MSRYTFHIITALFFVFYFSAPPFPAAVHASPSPELKDIIVTTSTSDLLLFASVQNSFTREMITGAQNGIPITFTYKIGLVKIQENWFNKSLVDLELTHTLTYDSLKQKYLVQRSSHLNKVISTRSLDEAKQLMVELNGIRLLPLSKLQPDAPYRLRIKAILEKTTLPFGMHYILPFTSLWDFETDWRILEFRY